MSLSETRESKKWAELQAENERLRHERDMLGKAIANAAIKLGICRDDVPLTGPMLLMLCDDIAEMRAPPQ